MSETPHRLPFHIDTEALKLGDYAVLDLDYQVVQVFDTEAEAEEFVAEANGSDVETVRRETIELGRMLAQYRDNLIRGSRKKSQPSGDRDEKANDGTGSSGS